MNAHLLIGNALPHWECSPWLQMVSLVGNALSGWERKAPGRPYPCCSTLMAAGHFFLKLVTQDTLHSGHSRLHHVYLEVFFSDAFFFAPSTSLSSGPWIFPPPWWVSGPATPPCSRPSQVPQPPYPPSGLLESSRPAAFNPDPTEVTW